MNVSQIHNKKTLTLYYEVLGELCYAQALSIDGLLYLYIAYVFIQNANANLTI